MAEEYPRKIAVIDGCGDYATVGLYQENSEDDFEELGWPQDWPERVTGKFLSEKGFEVVIA